MKDLIKRILEQEVDEGRKEIHTKEDIINIACQYDTRRDFAKNHDYLAKKAYRLKFMDDIVKICNYRNLGNLYNRMVYMYLWVDKIKALYIGLTCDEEKRFKQHVFKTSLGDLEMAPGCPVGDSAVRDFINEHGPYDYYFDISKGYVDAEHAASIEKLGIAFFRQAAENLDEFSGWTVVNKTDGGELGGRYSLNARQAIIDAKKIIEDNIENPKDLMSKYPEVSDYWNKNRDRKRILNKELKRRFFEDAPYEINELLNIVKKYNSFEELEVADRRAAKSLKLRKKMIPIVFPQDKIFYDKLEGGVFNTLKEVSEFLKVDFINLYHDFLFDRSERRHGILLIPEKDIKNYQNIESTPDDLVESFFRQINESKTPEERTLKYLSNLNLEPWEDVRYNMEYLVVPNSGQIIFLLVKSDFECSIQDHFYNMLKMFFKDDEQEMTYFVYDYLKENGLDLPFHKEDFWLSSSPENGVANREDGDRPMKRKQINESNEMETLKRYFYKKWDREKKEGKRPTIFDLDKLGLSKFRNEIVMLFVEYMGYNDVNSRSEAVRNYLMNGTFSEDDIKEMDNFDQGKIQVRFSNVEFKENYNEVKNNIDLDCEFVVLSGSFYNSEEGQTYNFSSGDNPFDDFVSYWEFKEEVEQVVESFVFNVVDSFGFNINNDFDYINVKW